MSRCWCKCEAGLGQCGPKVPRLKSLFTGHKQNDDASLRHVDRQAELQLIWDALEEGVRRRSALEENVMNSEKRLAEILGPESIKFTALGDVDMEFMLSWLSSPEVLQSAAFAPSQLPLQTRLDMNMARLHELDSERLGAYGWVGGLVVMVELRHRVLLLRETLRLPPCDPLADLDKVLVSTMEDLSILYPSKATPIPICEMPCGEQKPVMQRLQRFYQFLRAIESSWVETLVQKDPEGLNDHMEKTAQTCLQNIEEKRNVRKRTRDAPRKSESALGSCTSNTGSGGKSQSNKNKITRPNTPSSEESQSVEMLSQNIINKLDTMNQHLKRRQESPSCSSLPFSDTSRHLPETIKSLLEKSEPAVLACSDVQEMHSSPSTYLCGKSVRTPTSVRTRNPNLLTLGQSTMLPQRELHHPAETPIEVVGLPRADLLPCTARENQKMQPADSFGVRMLSIGVPNVPSKSPSREPLIILPNCTVGPGVHAGAQGVEKPGPIPPPPPPPPMPPSGAGFLTLKKHSSNLKRSVKMSRLYRNLRTKIEGAAHIQANTGLGSSSRRISTSGTREGMAEALAEITKKSTYFQKIEDDVQRYRKAIEESKRALDSFETVDMEQLLRFHKKLESILENLTDETQVLARFKAFPSNKLETLRLAAALYSRLLSMAQELEKWEVQAPISEHMDKVTRYFEKIKKDLEVVEGSKEEDVKRFTNQKIKFDFSILERIKEAMVGVSSRCLVQVLEESKRDNRVDIRDKGRPQAYDSSRQRLCSQMLWKAFQLAYRVYNFAGGHDDKSEGLISEIASEIESYPSDVWL